MRPVLDWKALPGITVEIRQNGLKVCSGLVDAADARQHRPVLPPWGVMAKTHVPGDRRGNSAAFTPGRIGGGGEELGRVVELDQEVLVGETGEFLGDDVGRADSLARSAPVPGAGPVINGMPPPVLARPGPASEPPAEHLTGASTHVGSGGDVQDTGVKAAVTGFKGHRCRVKQPVEVEHTILQGGAGFSGGVL
jgi:hypothetical protein